MVCGTEAVPPARKELTRPVEEYILRSRLSVNVSIALSRIGLGCFMAPEDAHH